MSAAPVSRRAVRGRCRVLTKGYLAATKLTEL